MPPRTMSRWAIQLRVHGSPFPGSLARSGLTTAVPAQRPDVGIVHAQQADRRGNVRLWGIVGVQKEAAFAATRASGMIQTGTASRARQPHPSAGAHPASSAAPSAPRRAQVRDAGRQPRQQVEPGAARRRPGSPHQHRERGRRQARGRSAGNGRRSAPPRRARPTR